MAAGLPLCFLGPLLLACIFWYAFGQLFNLWFPWVWIFGALCLIMIPALFHPEWRSKGSYMTTALEGCTDDDLLDFGWASLTAAVTWRSSSWSSGQGNIRKLPIGLVEFFLFGPRLVLLGYGHLRNSYKMSKIDLRSAAELLLDLLKSGASLHPTALVNTKRNMKEIIPLLIWLSYYEWVGTIEETRKVFVFTAAKERLQMYDILGTILS